MQHTAAHSKVYIATLQHANMGNCSQQATAKGVKHRQAWVLYTQQANAAIYAAEVGTAGATKLSLVLVLDSEALCQKRSISNHKVRLLCET